MHLRLSGYGNRRAPNTGVSQHIFAKALTNASDFSLGDQFRPLALVFH